MPEYPSSAEHPKFAVTDPRATASPPTDFEIVAIIDNGACFDVATGRLEYPIARDYGVVD